MTIHNFVCDACGAVVQDTSTKGIHRCVICGSDMRWDMKTAIHGNYERPIHSDALAISPDQISEHEKNFPNIRLDKQCRPILDNYINHENYLKKRGFRKITQKIKPKGARIS